MTLAEFHRLRIDAEECGNLEEYMYEESGSLPAEYYSEDGSADKAIKIMKIIWELTNDFTFKKLRAVSGMTQAEFVREYRIPRRTVEHWDVDERTPPSYVLELLAADILSAKIKDEIE